MALVVLEVVALKTRRFPTFTRWVQAHTRPEHRHVLTALTLAGAGYLCWHLFFDDPLRR